jgi:putative restriction endonuclease
MDVLTPLLQKLAPEHRQALEWFTARAGSQVGWPDPLPSGALLVTKAKGIYKPRGMDYALSVRQTLGGPYPDRDPIFLDDGSWRYSYYQEGEGESARDSLFTNRGLIACSKDSVPVGVLRQSSASNPVVYDVLGVALVSGWSDGYFHLAGFSWDRTAHAAWSALSGGLGVPDGPEIDGSDFEPTSLVDARERALSAIVQRRGQKEFRKNLLSAYNGRCAVSGTDAMDALEAAHIVPYLGPETNRVENGLLLRADLHTLFDLRLLTVDPDTLRVVLAPSVRHTTYSQLHDQPLSLPKHPSEYPSRSALKVHLDAAVKQWGTASGLSVQSSSA